MLLTISTTHKPATDLGYLLHKNTSRLQTADLAVGPAHVFYPETTDDRCTVAVMIEVDPIALVRGRGGEGGRYDDYVNDRPYAASSFLSGAIVEFFSTAMGSRSKERAELANSPIPLTAEIPVLPARGGEVFLRALSEPLGYAITAERLPLDPRYPEWDEAPYFRLVLEQTLRLADLLNHLYVLIPVLDGKKHYYIGEDEVDKLLRRGGEWLANHPQKEEISSRYLRRNRTLVGEALSRLRELEDEVESNEEEVPVGPPEAASDTAGRLHDLRLEAARDAIKASGASRVLDLGCGDGKLLALLLKEPQFREIAGMDVSIVALERAQRRLHLDNVPERQAARIKLLHGSLVYRDRRLEGFDAAALVEVIEHIDPFRLNSLERVVFEFAAPRTVVVTTPNREFNALFETLPEGQMCHSDHRFEWTRAEFEAWATEVATRHGYVVAFTPIGPDHPTHGAPSQMAVFSH